jgi:hypothetical protein
MGIDRSAIVDAVSKAKDPGDFCNIAVKVYDAGNEDWVRKLYPKAINLAEDCRDLCYVAEYVANGKGMNDKKWAHEILRSI